jgi:hypothetical protein
MSESNGERLHAAFVTVGCYSMAWAGLLDVERDDFARAAAEYDRVAAERIAELEGEAIERQALFDKTFATLDETCTLFEQCAAENGALRERLTKLEAAVDSALDGFYGLSFTPSALDGYAKDLLDKLKRARNT